MTSWQSFGVEADRVSRSEQPTLKSWVDFQHRGVVKVSTLAPPAYSTLSEFRDKADVTKSES